MTFDVLQHADPIQIAAVFGLVLSVWLIVALGLSIRRALRIQNVERRLGVGPGPEQHDSIRVVRLWHEGRETTTTVPNTPPAPRLWHRVEQYFRDTGWRTPIVWILLGWLVAGALVGLAVWLLIGTPIPALASGAVVIILLVVYAKVQMDKRVMSFESQFADALAMIARSLRAGQPLLAGFQHASEQLPLPVRDVFSEICQQHTFGVTMEEALRRVGDKYDSQDMRLFATAVIIQLQTGANLAQVMDRLSQVIRDRIRLGRRVRVLTAQTRFSTRILVALPFLVFFGIHMINPEYMNPLYDTPTGKLLLTAGATSLLLGMWSMKWLSTLRY